MLVRIAMTEGMQSELSFVSLLFPQDYDVLKAPNSTPEFDTSCNISYRLEPSLNYSWFEQISRWATICLEPKRLWNKFIKARLPSLVESVFPFAFMSHVLIDSINNDSFMQI